MKQLLFKNTKRITSCTSKIYYPWAIVGAPIIQEIIFRFIPYYFIYIPTGRYWEVAIIISVLFAAIHWYFGKWFVIYTFVMGLIYWWVMVNFGLVAVIIAHSAVNIVDLATGWRKKISRMAF